MKRKKKQFQTDSHLKKEEGKKNFHIFRSIRPFEAL
jgi:hypothetical protein